MAPPRKINKCSKTASQKNRSAKNQSNDKAAFVITKKNKAKSKSKLKKISNKVITSKVEDVNKSYSSSTTSYSTTGNTARDIQQVFKPVSNRKYKGSNGQDITAALEQLINQKLT